MITSVVLKNSKRNEVIKSNKALTILAFIIVFGFISAIMIGFSVMTISRLREINQSNAFVNMLLLLNFIILFSESIFHSLNTLYFSKDLGIFLRLPIKPVKLVKAKIIDMIISQYQMEALMLAIPMFVYGIIMNMSISFYLFVIGILIILPVIPICIISLIVSILMRFTNFMKNKSVAMYITAIIALVFVWGIIANIGGGEQFTTDSFQNMIIHADGLANELSETFILMKPIMNILSKYNELSGIINLLIYFLESIAIYELVSFIISKIYLKGAIGTTVNGKKARNKLNKLELEDVQKGNVNLTYVKKELRIMLRTPIFLIQCVVMPIIYPIITAIAVVSILKFAQNMGLDVMSIIYENTRNATGFATFLSIGQAFFMLNFSSIIAVSKEARSGVLMKSYPISLEKQFKLKTIIGAGINLVPSTIISIGYYYCVQNILQTAILFVALFILNIIGEKVKLLIDLHNPQIKWNTEYTMMKQNTNVMYELFYTIMVIAILAISSVFVMNYLNIYAIIVLLILFVINIELSSNVLKNKEKIFKKLY